MAAQILRRWFSAAGYLLLAAMLFAWGPAPQSSLAQDDPFGFPENTIIVGEDPLGPAPLEPAKQPREQTVLTPKTAPQQADAPTDSYRQRVFWAEPNIPGNEKLHKALASRLKSSGLDFVDAPLGEVVDFLRAEYGIEIQIDQIALEDLGLSTEEKITASLRNISLQSALRLMLKQLELTHIIADEVLLITTEEVAERQLSVAVYPVGNLTASVPRSAS